MDVVDFKRALVDHIIKNEKSLSVLIENRFLPKLNIIFDIDHTLVFAFETSMSSINLESGIQKTNIISFSKILF